MSEPPVPSPSPFPSGTQAALRPVQMVSAMVGIGALMLSAVRIIVEPAAPMPSALAVAIVLVVLVGSALLIALPGGLALFWIHAWPSPRTAAAVEEGLEADGAESYLSEVLGFR